MAETLDTIIQRQKWVLGYLESLARCGHKDAEHMYIGHCDKVLKFLTDTPKPIKEV